MKKRLLMLILFSCNNELLAENLPNPYNNPKISSEKLLGISSHAKIEQLCKTHEKLGTQGEIGCAKYRWEQADKSLNHTYQKILVQTKNKHALKSSQTNWLKKRDKECNAVYADLHGNNVAQGGGTGVPIEFMDCMSDMAKQRQQQLLGLKKEF